LNLDKRHIPPSGGFLFWQFFSVSDTDESVSDTEKICLGGVFCGFGSGSNLWYNIHNKGDKFRGKFYPIFELKIIYL